RTSGVYALCGRTAEHLNAIGVSRGDTVPRRHCDRRRHQSGSRCSVSDPSWTRSRLGPTATPSRFLKPFPDRELVDAVARALSLRKSGCSPMGKIKLRMQQSVRAGYMEYLWAFKEVLVKLKVMQAFCPKHPAAGPAWGGHVDAGTAA